MVNVTVRGNIISGVNCETCQNSSIAVLREPMATVLHLLDVFSYRGWWGRQRDSEVLRSTRSVSLEHQLCGTSTCRWERLRGG